MGLAERDTRATRLARFIREPSCVKAGSSFRERSTAVSATDDRLEYETHSAQETPVCGETLHGIIGDRGAKTRRDVGQGKLRRCSIYCAASHSNLNPGTKCV